MNALDRLYIGAQTRAWIAKERIKEFFTAEDGVSNVVATIIILLIVVLIIGVFWNRLSEWLNGIMDRIFGSDTPSTKSNTEL